MRSQSYHASPATPNPRPRICALLGPRERTQVEAATDGHLTIQHRSTVTGIYDDIASGHADGAIISVALVRQTDVASLAALLRDLPATQVLGLIGEDGAAGAVAGTLVLGRAGVTRLVDVRERAGWTALREAFTLDVPEGGVGPALTTIFAAIEVEPDGTRTRCAEGLQRFLAAIFAPHATTAIGIAAELGVTPSTLASRFDRAGLPSPKEYLALAKLLRAAYLGEAPGLTIRDISERLQASSPQTYCRTVRHMTGMSAGQFRRTVNGATALERFTQSVIIPYRDTLRGFDPVRMRRPAPQAALAGRAA